jgi:hypothetical protein
MRDAHTVDGRIPFRLRIGVTGHRDPLDLEAAASAARERLTEIERRFPNSHSTEVSFVVLSSLAEGADRIVAEQAREVLADRGVELHAVLPMKAEDYRQDFPDSVSTFDALLGPPTVTTELSPAKDRNTAYELAGRFIVDHSDVVIALWDGHTASGPGGTAEIVGHARRRGVPVLVVATRRAKDPDRAPHQPEWALEPWSLRDSTSESLRRIDEFNRGHMEGRASSAHVERQRARLGESAVGSAIHWQFEVVANWALPRLVRADALALRYQRLFYLLGDALYGLAALAVAAIAAQSQWHWSRRIALVEVGFMLVLLAIYGVARHIRLHERWVGYRSLTEAFRSALFIVLSDAHRRRADAGQELGPTDTPWFQRAFSEAWVDRPTIEHARANARDLRRFLAEAWLDDQIRYQRNAAQRYRRRRERLTAIVFLMFGATVVIGTLHAFGAAGGSSAEELFTFLAIALPAFGAALVGIRDQRQFRVHEDRSARTAARLERLRRDMESQTTLRSVERLAARIQALIETENLDWSGVIEFQDLEMVL